MLIGPIIWLVFPVICIFMPHQRTIATVLGLMTMGIIGVGTMAWVLGINRYLYVTAMPEEKRTGYSAVYYANQTFAVCLGPLISGVMIDKMSLMRNWFAQYSVSPYMPVFALGFLGLLGGTILMGGVRSSGELTLYSFVRLFLRRDSVRSCLAIMQVRFAKTEQKRAKVALVLRHLENPLVKHEIDLLRIDPSALVRLAMSGDCASVSDLVRSSDTGAELADNESFLRITEKLGSTADAAEALDLTYTLAKRFCRQEQFYSCWKQLNDDPATGAASLFWKLRGEFARFFADTAFLALSMETSDKYARREFALANALAAELALKLSAKDHSAAHVLKACSFRLSRSADIDIASLAFLSCLPLKEPMHCL
jgi:hypothetical protein